MNTNTTDEPKRSAAKEPPFDTRDAVFFGGLVIGAVGGFMLSVAWTLVAVGAVLTFASGPFRRGG
jgi:hypothetical protein